MFAWVQKFGFIDGWMHVGCNLIKKHQIPRVSLCVINWQTLGSNFFELCQRLAWKIGIRSLGQACHCFPNQFDNLLHIITQFRFSTSQKIVGLRKLPEVWKGQIFCWDWHNGTICPTSLKHLMKNSRWFERKSVEIAWNEKHKLKRVSGRIIFMSMFKRYWIFLMWKIRNAFSTRDGSRAMLWTISSWTLLFPWTKTRTMLASKRSWQTRRILTPCHRKDGFGICDHQTSDLRVCWHL